MVLLGTFTSILCFFSSYFDIRIFLFFSSYLNYFFPIFFLLFYFTLSLLFYFSSLTLFMVSDIHFFLLYIIFFLFFFFYPSFKVLVIVWCCAQEKEVHITRILGLELISEGDRRPKRWGFMTTQVQDIIFFLKPQLLCVNLCN